MRKDYIFDKDGDHVVYICKRCGGYRLSVLTTINGKDSIFLCEECGIPTYSPDWIVVDDMTEKIEEMVLSDFPAQDFLIVDYITNELNLTYLN